MYDDRSCYNCRYRKDDDCCYNTKSLHEGQNVNDVLICGKWEEAKDEMDK